MIIIKNSSGEIRITEESIFQFIKHEAVSCYGVASLMTDKNGKDDKSIKFTYDGKKADIEIHISVTYGLNITAIVTNVEEKLINSVGNLTGISVENVAVYVDSVNISE